MPKTKSIYTKPYALKVDPILLKWLKQRGAVKIRALLYDAKNGRLEKFTESKQVDSSNPITPPSFDSVECNARFIVGRIGYCKPTRFKKPRELISPKECETCFRIATYRTKPNLRTTQRKAIDLNATSKRNIGWHL